MNGHLLLKNSTQVVGKIVRDHLNNVLETDIRSDLTLGDGSPDYSLITEWLGNLPFLADGITPGYKWDGSKHVEIDDTDRLNEAKRLKRQELKIYATDQAALIYPFIKDPSVYLFAEDIILQLKSVTDAIDAKITAVTGSPFNSWQPLTGDLLAFKGVKDIFDIKKAEINALTTIAQVEAYDIPTEWEL